MPKMKSNKATVKRFKVTKTGKIMRRRQYGRHLRSAKSSEQKRRYNQAIRVDKTMLKTIKRLLGRA